MNLKQLIKSAALAISMSLKFCYRKGALTCCAR